MRVAFVDTSPMSLHRHSALSKWDHSDNGGTVNDAKGIIIERISCAFAEAPWCEFENRAVAPSRRPKDHPHYRSWAVAPKLLHLFTWKYH